MTNLTNMIIRLIHNYGSWRLRHPVRYGDQWLYETDHWTDDICERLVRNLIIATIALAAIVAIIITILIVI